MHGALRRRIVTYIDAHDSKQLNQQKHQTLKISMSTCLLLFVLREIQKRQSKKKTKQKQKKVDMVVVDMVVAGMVVVGMVVVDTVVAGMVVVGMVVVEMAIINMGTNATIARHRIREVITCILITWCVEKE